MSEVIPGGGVAPVETPAFPPVAAPEATTQPDPTAGQIESTEPEAKPERTFTQKELDEIVQKRLSKESKRVERVARAEAEAAYLRQQLEARDKPPQTPQPQGKPKLEDFAGKPYDEYIDALTDWKLEQREAKQRETSQRETQETYQRRSVEENARFVQDKIISEGRKQFPDFIDVVMGEDVDGITEPMVAAATRLSNGPQVLYQLGKNEAERMRIAALSPIEQVWELKDLSAKLSAAPKTTNAPPPIKPNETAAKAETGYRADMTDKQYADWRRRQKAQSR